MPQIPYFAKAVAFALALVLGTIPAAAQDSLSGKTFGMGVTGGFPQFIGLDLSYIGWPSLVPGISFGSAPIQQLLSSKIPLNPIPISFSLPDTYNLIPSADFSLYSVSAYVKYFFPNSGFYLELLIASLSASANVGGDLKNETTQLLSYSVISGSAKLNQSILGVATGFRVLIFSKLFMEGALGGGYLLPPTYSISIGGTISNIVGIIPNGEQDFNNAKAQVQSSFDTAMATYRASVKILPFAFINIGFIF